LSVFSCSRHGHETKMKKNDANFIDLARCLSQQAENDG
jgi:hypothetical protein